jgi:hypothetical protein
LCAPEKAYTVSNDEGECAIVASIRIPLLLPGASAFIPADGRQPRVRAFWNASTTQFHIFCRHWREASIAVVASSQH